MSIYLIEQSLIEALYTVNSPLVVSFNVFRYDSGHGVPPDSLGAAVGNAAPDAGAFCLRLKREGKRQAAVDTHATDRALQ